jgi:hypothetical protein
VLATVTSAMRGSPEKKGGGEDRKWFWTRPGKRATGQKIGDVIMLFAAAAESASNGEEQTQTSPDSIQTTERYLGCKQRFHDAVNDHIGLEPDAPS